MGQCFLAVFTALVALHVGVVSVHSHEGMQCGGGASYRNGSLVSQGKEDRILNGSTADECCSACADSKVCNSWTFKNHTKFCFLIAAATPPENNNPVQPCVRGYKNPPPAPPPPSPLPPAPKQAMNVLMIAVDDLRPEMTPYGHTHMHTPNLERLANRSMLFERAYVSVALCMPRYSASHQHSIIMRVGMVQKKKKMKRLRAHNEDQYFGPYARILGYLAVYENDDNDVGTTITQPKIISLCQR
eukprot:m.682614 g.682614  ORF g.682614 m.682614 type:complete len:244 (+) comp22821_c0_seq7:312-1043(+)